MVLLAVWHNADMQLYRFSPIQNEETFWKAAEYTAEQMKQLSQKVLNEILPIYNLKLFPHYSDEYTYLHQLLTSMGPQAPAISKTSFYVTVDKIIAGEHITALGVRVVDPYRMQVGCGDYTTDKYEVYKQKVGDSPFIRYLEHTNMLEIWHPDFDVLGYILPKE